MEQYGMIIIIMKSLENTVELASFLMQVRMKAEEIEQRRSSTLGSYRQSTILSMVDEAEEFDYDISQSECEMDIQQMPSQSTLGLIKQRQGNTKKVKNIIIIPPSSVNRLSVKKPSEIYQHSKNIMKDQNISWTNHKNQYEIVYLAISISAIGQTYIKLRINNINGQMCVGLTGNYSKSRHIEDNRNQIRLNLNGKEIMIDGQLFSLNCNPFISGDTIRICVDISRKIVKFYRNEKDKSCLQVSIPDCMAKLGLVAFIEMANSGDSITLLV